MIENIDLSRKFPVRGIMLLLLVLLPMCQYAQSDNLNSVLEKNQYLQEGDPGYAEFMAAVTNLNNDSSMYYAEALRQVAETTNSPLTKIYYYKILSSIYLDRDYKDMAIDASRHQADLAQRYNYPLQLFDAYDKIANTLILQNKFAEAHDVFSTFEESLKEMAARVDSNTERQMRLQKDRSDSSQVVLVLFFLMSLALLADSERHEDHVCAEYES